MEGLNRNRTDKKTYIVVKGQEQQPGRTRLESSVRNVPDPIQVPLDMLPEDDTETAPRTAMPAIRISAPMYIPDQSSADIVVPDQNTLEQARKERERVAQRRAEQLALEARHKAFVEAQRAAQGERSIPIAVVDAEAETAPKKPFRIVEATVGYIEDQFQPKQPEEIAALTSEERLEYERAAADHKAFADHRDKMYFYERHPETKRLIREEIGPRNELLADEEAHRRETKRQANRAANREYVQRAQKIVASRTEATNTLRALEDEARHSVWAAFTSLATRARERARISSYTRQLEDLYAKHPYTAVLMRTDADREREQRIREQKLEQELYNDRRYTMKLEKAHAGVPGPQNNEAFVRAFNSLSQNEKIIRTRSLPERDKQDLRASLARIAKLDEEIANTKPSFFDRLRGIDPAQRQRQQRDESIKIAYTILNKNPEILYN